MKAQREEVRLTQRGICSAGLKPPFPEPVALSVVLEGFIEDA